MNIYGRPMFQGGSIRMAPSIKPLPRYQNGGIVKHHALHLEKYQNMKEKLKEVFNIYSETGAFVNPEAAYALLEKMAADGIDIRDFLPQDSDSQYRSRRDEQFKKVSPVKDRYKELGFPTKGASAMLGDALRPVGEKISQEWHSRRGKTPPYEFPQRWKPNENTEPAPDYSPNISADIYEDQTDTRGFPVPREKPMPPDIRDFIDKSEAVSAARGGPIRRQAGGGIEAVMPTDLGALVEPPPMPMPAPPPPGIDEALPQVEQAAQNVGEQEGAQYAMEVMSGLNAAEESGDPEQAINALRGNEMPISGRYEELATYVGDDDAERTPESVLLMVQPTIMLTEQGAMDSGIGSLMENVVGDIDMETAQGAPTAMGEGVGSLMMAQADMEVGQEPPVNFNYGGPVQRFSNGKEVIYRGQWSPNKTKTTELDETPFNKLIKNIQTWSETGDDPYLQYKQMSGLGSNSSLNPDSLNILRAEGTNFSYLPEIEGVYNFTDGESNNNPDLSNAITGAKPKKEAPTLKELAEAKKEAPTLKELAEAKKEAPTLKELAEARANLYKDILGTEGQWKLDEEELEESKKLTQAQVFFDIAQGGLALAAGDPTLSFAENVARAAAPVVSKISERSAEFTKEKRVLDKARRAQEQAIKLKSVDAVIKAQTDAAAAMTKFERDKFLKLMEMGAKKQSNLMVNIDSDLARIEGFDWKNTALKRGDKGAYKNLEDAKKTFNYLLGRKNDEIPGGGFTVSLTKFLRKAGNIFGVDQSNMQETLQELSTLEKSMAFDFNVFTSIIPGISTRDASGIAIDEKEYASMIPAYADSGVFDAGSLKSELNKAQLLYDGIKTQVIDTAATINDLASEGKNTSDVYSRLKARYTYGKQLMGKLQGYIKVMDPNPQPSMKSSGRAATKTSNDRTAFHDRLGG